MLEAFKFLLGKLEIAKALIKNYPEPKHTPILLFDPEPFLPPPGFP
jgi:hypothetical protein